MRIYFDSAPMIYYVEQIQPWYAKLLVKLAPLSYRPVISDLTRMECRIKPLRLANTNLLYDFDLAFTRTEVLSLTAPVFDRAAIIRATFNYGAADSIHLAVAVENACDQFLTNDQKLVNFPDIKIELI